MKTLSMRITPLTALLTLVLCLIGCGNPDEAANQLFVEAVELVKKGESQEIYDIFGAIESYEAAIIKIRKIVNEHKKSALAVKLISNETLFTGQTVESILEKIGALLVSFEEMTEVEKSKHKDRKETKENEKRASGAGIGTA